MTRRIVSSRLRCPNCPSHQYSISASSAAVGHFHFPSRFRDRSVTHSMVPAWTAYDSPTGLPVVAAKPVGQALPVVQVHVPLLAVAANIAAGRWKNGALTSAVPSSVVTSAYRTDGSPAGFHAAPACIPTGPLAAALAGLVLEMAAATR